ncbi:MAG: hypothetical protein L0332_12365 [Chloroflexi bacterium]|nr:hypothetical protein [Chloroflexota bacterium]MCI0574877.1 hypothetical protein [Chloroflexota bacterium]MCI0648379.1 hypothetical protein [Chloroflexota bacterium]MCI0727500.1 hypothetical protein [Chloroflexota bacterium]
MFEREEDHTLWLDEALIHYPVAPLPAGFVRRVMDQVATLPQEPVAVYFRLQLVDLVAPLFLSLFLAFILVLGLWLRGTMDVAWLPPNPAPPAWLALPALAWLGVGAIVVMGEVALVLLVGVYLWLDRPHIMTSTSVLSS